MFLNKPAAAQQHGRWVEDGPHVKILHGPVESVEQALLALMTPARVTVDGMPLWQVIGMTQDQEILTILLIHPRTSSLVGEREPHAP